MHKSFATIPRFYAQVICKIATMVVIFWVLKRTVSLRWYYICFSWKHLKRIYWFLFCVFKDISFTVAPLDFWNSCKRLQNRKSPIYNHGFISWVLKRTVSLRWYYICFSWKHLKRIYRFLFCVFKDISFTVAPLDFWNSCKRLQIVKPLFTTMVLYLGCSKEPSLWDGTFEYSQDIYWLKTL